MKNINSVVKTINISKPVEMDYSIFIGDAKHRHRFIDRIEKQVRQSLEYRDYIQFLKENANLNKCIFFNNISQNGKRSNRISLELHHEPFTLFDIVSTVVNRYEAEGIPLNSLLIADEVLKLHYENKVGLVPLSKTMHQMIHNSDKIKIPLTAVYGNYNEFLNEYEPYAEENGLFDKLEKKLELTKNLTEKDFEAIKTEFKYLDVEGVDDVNKMEVVKNQIA